MTNFAVVAMAFAILVTCGNAAVQVGNSFPEGVQMSSSSEPTCNPGTEGLMFYSSEQKSTLLCDGTQWISLLTAASDFSNVSAVLEEVQELRNVVRCNKRGTWNSNSDVCDCYDDVEHGHYAGDSCDHCKTGWTTNMTSGALDAIVENGQLINDVRCDVDIDECAAGTHNCNGLMSCSNIVEGFDCTCPAGFEKNEQRVCPLRYYRLVILGRNYPSYSLLAQLQLYENDVLFSPSSMTSRNSPSPYAASAPSCTYEGDANWRVYFLMDSLVDSSPLGGMGYHTGECGDDGEAWALFDMGAGNEYVPTSYKFYGTHHNRWPRKWHLYGSATGEFNGEEVLLDAQHEQPNFGANGQLASPIFGFSAAAMVNGSWTCPGGVSPVAPQRMCMGCREGYAGTTGECEVCPDGTEPSLDKSSCQSCPPAYAGTSGVCARCPDGTQPNAQQSACEQCPAGTSGTGGTCESTCSPGTAPNLAECAWAFRHYRLNVLEHSPNGVSLIGQIQYFNGDSLISPSTMTSPSAPAPFVVTAPSCMYEGDANWRSWFPFDSIIGSSPSGGMGIHFHECGSSGYVSLDLGSAQPITKYTLYCTSHNRCPTAFQLVGSNTGSFTSEETIIDEQTGLNTWGGDQPHTFHIRTAAGSLGVADNDDNNCPADQVVRTPVLSFCESCGGNTASTDGTACTPCPNNEVPSSSHSSCDVCPAGTHPLPEAACPARFYRFVSIERNHPSYALLGQLEYFENGERFTPRSMTSTSSPSPYKVESPSCTYEGDANWRSYHLYDSLVGTSPTGGMGWHTAACEPVYNEIDLGFPSLATSYTAYGTNHNQWPRAWDIYISNTGSFSGEEVLIERQILSPNYGADASRSFPMFSYIPLGNDTLCAGGAFTRESSSMCIGCPLGHAGVGGSCEQCADGTHPNSVRTACDSCPDGWAGVGGVCEQCPDGTQPNTAKTECELCPPGWAGTGGSCSQCADGRTSNVPFCAEPFRYYRMRVYGHNTQGSALVGQIQYFADGQLFSPSSMTSQTSPAPYTASANSCSYEGDPNWRSWYAYDSTIGSSPSGAMGWHTNGCPDAFNSLDVGTPWGLSSYSIWTTNHNRGPRTWEIWGSHTGAFAGEEVVVDSQSEVNTWGADSEYALTLWYGRNYTMNGYEASCDSPSDVLLRKPSTVCALCPEGYAGTGGSCSPCPESLPPTPEHDVCAPFPAFRYYRWRILESNYPSYALIGQLQIFFGSKLVTPNNMVSDTSPAPYAVYADPCSYEGDANWREYFVFDSYISSSPSGGMGFHSNGCSTAFVMIDLGTATHATSYTMWSTHHNRSPRSWRFEGSNTGAFNGEETVIDTQSGVDNWGANAAISFSLV